MRYFLVIIAILLAVGGGLYITSPELIYGACQRPLTYEIDRIDEEFAIATSSARARLDEAVAVWEEASGRDLFSQDDNADLQVRFVYDERQQRTDQASSFESELEDLEENHDTVTAEYERVANQYEAAVEDFKNRQQSYQSDLEVYNQRVARWNEEGGAPSDVHEELTAKKNELENMRQDLAIREREVERKRQQVNELAQSGNSLAREYNNAAQTYTDRFGQSQQFNQATFTGDTINIYQFEGTDDLRLALVHELGHALGIGHVDGSDSIMYYLMEDQPVSNLRLSETDRAALNQTCNL